mgnify:CR=1 FL=1
MIDLKFLRENPEIVKQNIKNKFQDQKLPLVDEVIELDAKARATQKEADELRASRNTLSKQIGQLMGQGRKDEAEAVKAQVSANAARLAELEETEKELQEEYPLFLQWDKRWGCLAYGDDSNVAISGCGPTTLAMAVVALTGNEEATPAAIAKFAMQEGFYMSGTGTMWSLMTEGAAAYGVRSEQINISQTEIKQHLDQGDIVICSVRQGDFTTGGHFILLYDYDDEGFSINDPFSLYRSDQKWDYGKIRSQIKAVWALKAK